MSRRTALVALTVALALAGCGGSDNASSVGADSAATIAPATAAAYVSVDTDIDSDQWKQLNELLEKFPGRDKIIDAVGKLLSDQNIDPDDLRAAAGPTVELVALGLEERNDFVGLAQPKDEAKFRALFEKTDEPVVFREIEGWTVFAETAAAIDRFEAARGSETLADDDGFAELMGELPGEALVKAWFETEGVTAAAEKQLGGAIPQLASLQPDAVSLAVEAADEGMRLLVHIRNDDVAIESPDFGELADQVPADALAFVNAHGYDGRLELTEQLRNLPGVTGFGLDLGDAERMLGVTLEEVSSLFNQEMVLWVRPGAIIPEVTLVLEVDDEAKARATVDRIVAAAGSLGQVRSSPRRVGDVDATQLDLGQFGILYAAFDGKLVLTTQPSGIEALTGDVDRLVDADGYKDAVEAAGVPDDENVIMWVDMERALGLVETLSALGGNSIPPDARANIDPLKAVVLSADPSLENGSIRLFAHVR